MKLENIETVKVSDVVAVLGGFHSDHIDYRNQKDTCEGAGQTIGEPKEVSAEGI